MKKITICILLLLGMGKVFSQAPSTALKNSYNLSGNQSSVAYILKKGIDEVNCCFDKIYGYIDLSLDHKGLIQGDRKLQGLAQKLEVLAEGAALLSLPVEEVQAVCNAILSELDFTQEMTTEDKLQSFKRAMIMKNMLIASFTQGNIPSNTMLEGIQAEKEYLKRYFKDQDGFNEKIKLYDDALHSYIIKSEGLVDQLKSAEYDYNHKKETWLRDVKDGNIQLSWWQEKRYYWFSESIDNLKKEQEEEYGQQIKNAEQEIENKKKALVKKQQLLDHDLMAIWADLVSDIYKKELKTGFLSEERYKNVSNSLNTLWYWPRIKSTWWSIFQEKYFDVKVLHGPLSYLFRGFSSGINGLRLSKTGKELESVALSINDNLEPLVKDLLVEFNGCQDVYWGDIFTNTNKIYFLTTFSEFLVKSKVFKLMLPKLLRGIDEKSQQNIESFFTVLQETLVTLSKGGFSAASLLSLAGLAGENNVAFALRVLKHILLMARYEEKDEVYSNLKKANASLEKLVKACHEAAQNLKALEKKLEEISKKYLKYGLTSEDKATVLSHLTAENRLHLKSDATKEFDNAGNVYPIKFMRDTEKISEKINAKPDFSDECKEAIQLRKPIVWENMNIGINATQANWVYKPSWFVWLWNGLKWLTGSYVPTYWDHIRNEFKNQTLRNNVHYRKPIDKSKFKEIDEIDNAAIKELLYDIKPEKEEILQQTLKQEKEIAEAFDLIVDYLNNFISGESSQNTILETMDDFEKKGILDDLLAYECPYKKKTIYNYVLDYQGQESSDPVISYLVKLYNLMIEEGSFEVPQQKQQGQDNNSSMILEQKIGSEFLSILAYCWNKPKEYINSLVDRTGTQEINKHIDKQVEQGFQTLKDFIVTESNNYREESEKAEKYIQHLKDWKVFDAIKKHRDSQGKTLKNIAEENYFVAYRNQYKATIINQIIN